MAPGLSPKWPCLSCHGKQPGRSLYSVLSQGRHGDCRGLRLRRTSQGRVSMVTPSCIFLGNFLLVILWPITAESFIEELQKVSPKYTSWHTGFKSQKAYKLQIHHLCKCKWQHSQIMQLVPVHFRKDLFWWVTTMTKAVMILLNVSTSKYLTEYSADSWYLKFIQFYNTTAM
jgi:hypothetical protein